jgi:hypothetical protein
MFALTVFVYPLVLGLLLLGTGCLVDRASGRFMPASLLPAVGAAGLIALSQLTTYLPALAPATPYAMAAVAAAGFVLARRRIAGAVRSGPAVAPWALTALAYLIAIAPVLGAGRPTLSSYMALTDSAVHMLGADYLIHHGQSFAHLDLRNSYGQYLNAYYNHSYPSGGDTLFGGSALLLGLPLLWAYQPFCALMLAIVTGPAWLLVRRVGLSGAWAALATLSITVPALVYAYELIGSVKEIVALPLILALGALVVLHRRWLRSGPAAAIPFGLLVAGGASVIGVAFGAWALAATLPLLVIGAGELRAGTQRPTRLLLLGAGGAGTVLVCAWPTWSRLSGSLEVAQAIATTANPGNLHRPLRIVQALGSWLGGSYLVEPSGVALYATYAFIALALLALVLGVWHVLSRDRALAAWLALTLVVWVCLTESGSTWAGAKTLMLTSPAVLLVVWAGVAALRGSAWRALASALALALGAGVLISDALQYHASNLAPTARYEELASLNARYAGRAPALFTDYDEYALYALRGLDIGGPNFIYPPPALRAVVPRNGYPVDLDRIPPAALAAYPLIITRRDPATSRPPSAYRLLWQGTYYQLWGRLEAAPSAIAHVGLAGARAVSCASVRRVALTARAWAGAKRAPGSPRAVRLVGAAAPEIVRVPIAHASHSRRWSTGRVGLLMSGPGTLDSSFRVGRGGVWELWLEGELMPAVSIDVDGRRVGSIAGEVGGTSLTQEVMSPLRVDLNGGSHSISITRAAAGIGPGEGGWSDLRAIFLTPAASDGEPTLRETSAADWRSLCRSPLEWIEAVPVSQAVSLRRARPARA